MKRIVTAVVFLPIFWVLVKKAGALYQILVLAASFLALLELYRLAEDRGRRCHRILGAIVTLLCLASFAIPHVRIEYGLLFGLFAIPLASLLRRGGEPGTAFSDIGATFFGAAFVGILFGYLVALRGVRDLPK